MKIKLFLLPCLLLLFSCTKQAEVALEGININKSSLIIGVGGEEALQIFAYPEGAYDYEIIWKSSDESIATVSNGVVYGISKGQVQIVASTVDSKFNASSTVTVVDIEFYKETIGILEGNVLNIDFSADPAIIGDIEWSSSDSSIATVTNGEIRGIAEGTAIIYAKYKNINRSCIVKVESLEPKKGDIYTVRNLDGVSSVWKNDNMLYKLSENEYMSIARQITVIGNDVYAIGEIRNEEDIISRPCIWKNGAPIKLFEDRATYVTSMAFNGDDIYVAGATTESTVIWKNGKQLLEFPDKSGKGIIIIDNNDIYLSTGKSVTVQTSSNSSHGFWVGVVYKNDQLLYQLTESTASQIESMYLYNGDIYTCGCSENYAKVWVNGKPIDTNNITGMFSSIFVSENKIYALYDDLVSGSFTPMLFCDGNSIKLNKEYGGAMNIVVKDGNEYICCERAVLKNRSIVVSRTGYEVIYSMFVI